jgi:hypothetical protein
MDLAAFRRLGHRTILKLARGQVGEGGRRRV